MWEWRIFGSPELVPHPPRVLEDEEQSVEREDIYLLGHGHDRGLKIRGSTKVELKLGHERHEAGHERWEKVFDARLPLEPEALLELHGLLGSEPGERRPLLTAGDVIGAFPGLKQVRVRKRIAKVIVAGSHVLESTVVSVDGTTWHSIAVEAPTAERCFELGREAGLPLRGEARGGVIVAGYPEALARLSVGG